MKKQIFYTMIYHHGATRAVRVNGYTDGAFNYYKNTFGRWHAIEPTTGLDVYGMQPTRKAAQDAATTPERLAIIKRKLENDGPTLADRLQKLIPEAIDYAQL